MSCRHKVAHRSDACYYPLSPTACVVNYYASELQTVVNEPIYNGNSYFILNEWQAEPRMFNNVLNNIIRSKKDWQVEPRMLKHVINNI